MSAKMMDLRVGVFVVADATHPAGMPAVPDDDPVGFIGRLGEEAAPAAREKVALAAP